MPTAASTDKFKPGQSLRCTVAKTPRTDDQRDTIERLMRQDPAVQRGLKRAQRNRRQGMVVYNRGNRDWYKRENCGKIVIAEAGSAWTMRYTPNLAPDIEAVAAFVTLEPA